MPLLSRRHATWIILAAHFSTSAASPPPADGEYSPPTATVIVVVVALFLTVGLLAVYFRYFALCLGYGGTHGGAWRRGSARGLDSLLIESFPTFPYSDVKLHRIGKGTLECAICLTEFSDDHEVLQILPVCNHVFHRDCIVPWLASHVTCPVCRANLEFQRRDQHFEMLLEHLRHLSDEELEPSDQINQPDHTITIKTPVQEIKDEVECRGKFARSHSTGHSLVGDCERFTLRLPEEVRIKLVTANQSILPAMLSPRIGYRVGFSPPGSTQSPIRNLMSGPKNLLKLIKSPLNRGKPQCTSDIGEGSLDKLWQSRRPDSGSDG